MGLFYNIRRNRKMSKTNYFNREIVFLKEDGSKWVKVCNEINVDGWTYLFKTYNWKVIEIKHI